MTPVKAFNRKDRKEQPQRSQRKENGNTKEESATSIVSYLLESRFASISSFSRTSRQFFANFALKAFALH